MKIQLIQKLAELDGGQFFEVFPGPFKGRAWNEQSVYIEDEAFALIESVVKKHAPEFDGNRNTSIAKEGWIAIISDLQELKNELTKVNSMEELPSSMQFRHEFSRSDFGGNVQGNVSSLITLIDAFIAWLTRELESQPVITILGI